MKECAKFLNGPRCYDFENYHGCINDRMAGECHLSIDLLPTIPKKVLKIHPIRVIQVQLFFLIFL